MLSNTYNAIKIMAKEIDKIMSGERNNKLFESIFSQMPGEKAENLKDLVFTGRVYIYHETYLLPERIEELTKAYEMENLSPYFRSKDYVIMKNSPLYGK